MRKDTNFISNMINKTQFLAEEIPFNEFQQVGISRKDVMNMPKDMIDKLLKGGFSPIIELKPTAFTGEQVNLLAKIQLVRTPEGIPELRIYPVSPTIRNSVNLREDEIEQLKEGKTISKELRQDGKRKLIYVELDHETNHLIIADAKRLRLSDKLNNINGELQLNGVSSIRDIELGANQKQQIREGKPVELDVGHQKVTVGVSLKESNGFKIVKGDMEEWKREKEIKWDIANPGKMGYWKTEQNRWEYEKSISKNYEVKLKEPSFERKEEDNTRSFSFGRGR